MTQISFRPLGEQDLALMYSWLQLPHVREFYHQKPVPSWEGVREKYMPRLDPAWPTRCFITRCNGSDVGYIQTYRVADYPDYAALIGEKEGISIDLFIGDPQSLGKGLGRRILVKFLSEVAFPLFSGEEVCWIYHDRANQRALRASRAAGFQYVRDIIEDGEPKELLMVQKVEKAPDPAA